MGGVACVRMGMDENGVGKRAHKNEEEWKCRVCENAMETEMHVVLECEGMGGW